MPIHFRLLVSDHRSEVSKLQHQQAAQSYNQQGFNDNKNKKLNNINKLPLRVEVAGQVSSKAKRGSKWLPGVAPLDRAYLLFATGNSLNCRKYQALVPWSTAGGCGERDDSSLMTSSAVLGYAVQKPFVQTEWPESRVYWANRTSSEKYINILMYNRFLYLFKKKSEQKLST